MKVTLALTACMVVAWAPAQDGARQAARAEYQAMKAAYDQARDASYQASLRLSRTPEFKKAVAAEDGKTLEKLRARIVSPDLEVWIGKFTEAAARHAPAPGEAAFLAWVAGHGFDTDRATECLEKILERHARSPDLHELAARMRAVRRVVGDPLADRIFAVLEHSPHPLVKANALYTVASQLVSKYNREATEEDRSAGMALMEEIAKLVPGARLEDLAHAPAFERDRLQVGMAVPDIVGKDLDGVEFKLSDYRGKVVVIDFWGDW